MTVAYLLKLDKFGSNFVLIKQNLPNPIILPPKNGGFKARSHSVRKANCDKFTISVQNMNESDQCTGIAQAWVRFLPEDLIVDEFLSTVPSRNFDLCIISTHTKTH